MEAIITKYSMIPSLAILEIFAEAAQLPSHVRERRRYRAALRDLSHRQGERERARLNRHADKFLRRRYYIEPLPPVCACVACGKHFNHARALFGHRAHCVAERRAT